MRRDNRAGIHHRIANGLGVFAFTGLDPDSVQSKCWIFAWLAGNLRKYVARINSHLFAAGNNTNATHRAIDHNLVRIGCTVEIVANANGRQQKAHFC